MDDWRRGGGRGDGVLDTVSEPEVNCRRGRSLLRRERFPGEAEVRECGRGGSLKVVVEKGGVELLPEGRRDSASSDASSVRGVGLLVIATLLRVPSARASPEHPVWILVQRLSVA